jgi:hypothetical protein
MRKKIGIFFLSEPNFDKNACKFLVLNLNKVQSLYQFEFPECEKRLVFETDQDSEKFSKFTALASEFPKEEYLIGITTEGLEDNRFWTKDDTKSIVTTDTWSKYFKPPSVFEYILCATISSLVQMATATEGTEPVLSHRETKGCLLDYGYFKEDFRVKISVGNMCDQCKASIKKSLGEDFLDAITKMWDFHEWVGEPDTLKTVAYDMKKFFKVDLNKDTGFYTTTRDRFRDAVPQIAIAIISIIGTALTYYILSLYGIIPP